ncbi:MAG: fibro-slime domain-containing protein [Phycisphaerales bacterium]
MSQSILCRVALVVLCVLVFVAETSAEPVRLPAVVRDFSTRHVDFQPKGVTGGVVTEVVMPDLGSDGTPVLNPDRAPIDFIDSDQSFAQWFHDTPGTNERIDGEIPFDNALTPDDRVYSFGRWAFFPIDNRGFGREGNRHNFHFTLELRTEFVYDSGDPITLRYRSDDDLWVFINGKRVIDLGGVRRDAAAHFVLDATSAADLGLVAGERYEMVLFYAERRTQEAVLRADVLYTP